MMANHRPVVVGVDGSPAAFGAVRWAADEAVRLRQPLRITHALEAPGPFQEPFDEQRLALDAAAEARQWCPGLEVTTATWQGTAARVLRDQSRHASLIVVGSRGRGGFQSLLVGSVGVNLASHAYCPVLVVHHAERWSGPEAVLPHHQPVVVGADGSVAAEHALGLGFAEAASRGVPLVAVRAWQEPEHRHGRAADVTRLAASAAHELSAGLEPWRAKFPAVEVRERVVRGHAVPVLLAEAQDALMVVLGARGRGGFEGLQLGAVTHQVLEHADAPVLVVRHG